MWIFADQPTSPKRLAKGDAQSSSDVQTNETNDGSIDNPPKLFDAINKHGLATFLIVCYHFFSLGLYLTQIDRSSNSVWITGKSFYGPYQYIDPDYVYERCHRDVHSKFILGGDMCDWVVLAQFGSLVLPEASVAFKNLFMEIAIFQVSINYYRRRDRQPI